MANYRYFSTEDLSAAKNFSGFNNQTLRITTLEYSPFVMKTVGDGDSKVHYYGLVVSLIRALAEALNFTISWQEPADGQYGSINSTGHWTGLVGDVHYGIADIAVAGLTINGKRATAVDFSVPYWEESIGVMVMSKEGNKLFTVFKPFSQWLWLTLLGALVFTAATLRKVGGLAQMELGHAEPTWSASFTSTFGHCFRTLVTQGNFHSVKSQSSRAIIAVWMSACVVLCASFTANLVAWLTITEHNAPFNTLHEMVAQTTYKFGAREGEVSLLLMETAAPGSIYSEMYQMIAEDPSNFVPHSTVGLGKVRTENYAFIADETMLVKNATDDCRISLINERFYKSGYGLAFPKNWPYKKYFDHTIYKLLEAGLVGYWKTQSFPQLREGCHQRAVIEAKSVRLADIGGLFLLLGLGVALGACMVIMEHFYAKVVGKTYTKSRTPSLRMDNLATFSQDDGECMLC